MPLTELTAWARGRPQFSPAQVLALVAVIAKSAGLRKKDRQALLAQVEGSLRALAAQHAPGPA